MHGKYTTLNLKILEYYLGVYVNLTITFMSNSEINVTALYVLVQFHVKSKSKSESEIFDNFKKEKFNSRSSVFVIL